MPLRWLHEQGKYHAIKLRSTKGGETDPSAHDGPALRLLSATARRRSSVASPCRRCTILDTGCRIEELLTARID